MKTSIIKTKILIGLASMLAIIVLVICPASMIAHADDIATASADAIIENIVVSTSSFSPKVFTYTITQEEEKNDSNGRANTTAVSIPNVTINAAKAGSATAGISDSIANINDSGIYTFLIRQTLNSGDGWTYDQSEYRLRLYVEDIGTIVKTLTLEQTKDKNGMQIANPTKVDKASFTNVNGKAGVLKIKKIVEDPESKEPGGTKYRFLFKKGTGMSDAFTPMYKITDSKGTVLNDQKLDRTCYYDGSKIKSSGSSSQLYYYVNISKGQTIEFTNLAAGMQMGRIREVANTAYTSSNTLIEGKSSESEDGCDKTKVDITDNTVLTVTNTYKSSQTVVATGIVLSIAPYVTLVAASGICTAIYVIAKKKMR